MEHLSGIRAAGDNPKLLEDLYQAARQEKEESQFTAALMACYEEAPDNVLYAAWFYRLQRPPQEEQGEERSINWKLAVPLSVVAGLVGWLLSGSRFDFRDGMPYLILAWAPVGTCFVIAFLTLTAGKHKQTSWLAVAVLVGLGLYVTAFTGQQNRRHYRDLMALHLPLLAWIGAGWSVLGRRSDHQNRFAFLIKSIEVFITGGLYLMAGGAFIGITVGMFDALGISLSDEIMRFLIGGGAGLIPVLVVAGVYDPLAPPVAQQFQQGLGRVISTLMRLLLPLTLLVLIIYLFVIPFNFMEPFRKREVLMVYNVMLFAIMGLLVGATPVHARGLASRHQKVLRTGILAVTILTVLISLYALSATVYRTVLGGITMNRLTVIGWNGVNIGVLISILYRQFKDSPAQWVRSLQSAFSWGIVGYIVWALFLIVCIPWLFRG